MSGAPSIAQRLEQPYPLGVEQVERFRHDGFIKLREVLDAETLEVCARHIRRTTSAHNTLAEVPMDERDTYQRAFVQVTNLWEKDEAARQLTFSRRLARIASSLLEVEGVRLWHDQALFKEPGGGFTPWHVDQQYWPMLTDRSVTAWIPLQAVPIEMGPMCFGRGSHRLQIARDLEISDESERHIAAAVDAEGIDQVFEPYELGEVSFHLGWTLHRAGPNTTETPREVFTIIYMDRDQRLAEPKNENQRVDHRAFTPSTKVGEVLADEKNPVLFEAES